MRDTLPWLGVGTSTKRFFPTAVDIVGEAIITFRFFSQLLLLAFCCLVLLILSLFCIRLLLWTRVPIAVNLEVEQ